MLVNNINYIPLSYNNVISNGSNTNIEAKAKSCEEVAFKGFFSNVFSPLQNSISENKAYNEIYNAISGKDRKNLEILKRTGKLKLKDSNDNSSTIQNLYKILTAPRIQGLNNKKILSETLERLANPFTIQQKFGHIPDNIAITLVQNAQNSTTPNAPKSVHDIDVQNSASCVAASVEFNLADKKPAEFARVVEGLTSPDMSVISKIKMKDISKNLLDSVYILKLFNANVLSQDWEKAELKISPDRDAIVRARVQASKTNPMERASIDVLLQSAFMQLGSQGTYNSLTDKRYGSLSTNDTGLTEFEKTFTETIINNEGEKTSLTYQIVDDNSVLTGYTTPPEMVKEHLLASLKAGVNVIIGVTETDSNNKIIGGHELTIIDSKTGKDGELYFVYQDSDDDVLAPVSIKAKDLIPKIHHAGLPTRILKDQKNEDNGIELLKKINKA